MNAEYNDLPEQLVWDVEISLGGIVVQAFGNYVSFEGGGVQFWTGDVFDPKRRLLNAFPPSGFTYMTAHVHDGEQVSLPPRRD